MIVREDVLKSLSDSVDSRVNLMNVYQIGFGYNSWLANYMDYRKLRSLSICFKNDDLAELANKLGSSLVNSEYFCMTASQLDAISDYLVEIREHLGASKKLEDK